MFLLYSPLNQGLKPDDLSWAVQRELVFLLYSPLNQGLKQLENIQVSFISLVFLLYSPLNQGLKHKFKDIAALTPFSFYSTVH